MTEWWAAKPVTTAFDKTRKLLLEPFNVWTWLKLIVIVFFVGGAGTSRLGSNFSNLGNYQAGPSDMQAIEQGVNTILSNTTLILIILAAVALVVIVALALAYLRNVFSFVFIQALASGDVHVIKPAMDSLGRGFRLFIFTLAVSLATLAVIIGFILVIILCIFLALKAGVSGATGIVVLLLAIFVMLVLLLIMIAFSVASAIFVGFTYDFVAPMVFFKGMGILESWSWLWESIKKYWQQYAVYVVVHWALELAVGIVMMFIILPIALLFIAILIAAGIMAAALAKITIVLTILIGLVMLVTAAFFILLMLAISMPVAVYFRYYSLDVLKQIDPSAVLYSDRFPQGPPPTLPA